MKRSKRELFNLPFSHIYIEKQAKEHSNTSHILQKYSKAKMVEIAHYKDVFSRGHQDFQYQKESPSLILGYKRANLIYEGASMCESFGNEHFYYTSIMMNCIYDCHYCYLQGMYTSGNIVIFVNIEDYFKEVDRLLCDKAIYLCPSYDTDLLAFERIIGYGRKWIEFAKTRPNLTIEIRTKSSNFDVIQDMKPLENVILAWTLSPDEVIKNYEGQTPSLEQRLMSIQRAIAYGWKVRICFDPLIHIGQWRDRYKELIDTTFHRIPFDDILDISVGVFRVSKDYLKRMRRHRRDSVLLNYPFTTKNGVCSYDEPLREQMLSYVYQQIHRYIPESKIYI